MSISRSITQLFLYTSLALLVAACSDGVGTTENPDLSTGGSGYTGPAARTPDVLAFQTHFYNNLFVDNRCGQCHGLSQDPAFVDKSDVNAAYFEAIQIVSLSNPGSSEVVDKARTGHHCWLASADACADTIESMIVNWATGSNITAGRPIQLDPPVHVPPGQSRTYPDLPGDFTGPGSVHELLTMHCQNCHEETATPLPIAPFFANDDAVSAYAAARPKMDIDTPMNSRLVVRLREESHNCWTASCTNDAQEMQNRITAFAGAIPLQDIPAYLVTSMALNLGDGIVASGGNRHEANQIALWEFKSGPGSSFAYDTSGKTPEITLQLTGPVSWLGGYGLDLANGYAFANNIDSFKLKERIQLTGQYAIEAWVIPANVSQQDAFIISYSDGALRNFTLGQEMYDYRFYNRVDDPDPLSLNGEPFYTTGDSGEEIAQASLQHVVANYDPFNGRTVFVNGVLVAADDRGPSNTSIGNVVWDDNYAFVIGADAGGGNNWQGQLRLVAIHDRALTPAQIRQNFELGVGAKFYLLFWVGHQINPGTPNPEDSTDQSYILFEVSQFDQYSYLFSNPMFINLDPTWTPPSDIQVKGMRIGINGREALVGQAFASMDVMVTSSEYDYANLGQNLSPVGTIIAIEKLPTTDEFFLTFETIGGVDRVPAYSEAPPAAPTPPSVPASPVVSDIGVRTFEEISATISAVTGVPTNDDNVFNGISVKGTYDVYIQQLPTIEAIDAFLPSHQMAIAQLALASCNTLVETPAMRNSYFAGFSFGAADESAAFVDDTERNKVIDPLLRAVTNLSGGQNLTSQPPVDEMRDTFGSLGSVDITSDDPVPVVLSTYDSLITQMINNCPVTAPCGSSDRTKQIVKAVCAAAAGSAAMLVQ